MVFRKNMEISFSFCRNCSNRGVYQAVSGSGSSRRIFDLLVRFSLQLYYSRFHIGEIVPVNQPLIKIIFSGTDIRFRLVHKITAMRFILMIFLFIGYNGISQTVTVMDFVQVKEDRRAEAIYFYENNWKLYRDIAVKKGYILSYRLELATADSAAAFDLVLITEYKDSLQYINSESNFRGILNSARPNGPLLLNHLQPADFRNNLFVKVTKNLFRSYSSPPIPENPGHLE